MVDAVVSFLETPDRYTRGMCVADDKVFKKENWGLSTDTDTPLPPRHLNPRRVFWRNAASKRSWLGCLSTTAIALIIAGTLYQMAIAHMRGYILSSFSLPAIWKLGFGAVNVSALVNPETFRPYMESETAKIMVANLPQSIFSFIYLFYNNIFTRMLLAAEWMSLAHGSSRGLRVSDPIKGSAQWSRQYLQLPYAYSIPLLTYSTLMHWMVSQSFFFVKLRSVSHGFEILDAAFSTCGWSAIALVFVIAGGTLMPVVTILLGFRRYPFGMPFAGSCSAVFAAASHNPDGGARVAQRCVRWGETWQWEKEEGEEAAWHCTFGDGDVDMPKKGRLYY